MGLQSRPFAGCVSYHCLRLAIRICISTQSTRNCHDLILGNDSNDLSSGDCLEGWRELLPDQTEDSHENFRDSKQANRKISPGPSHDRDVGTGLESLGPVDTE